MVISEHVAVIVLPMRKTFSTSSHLDHAAHEHTTPLESNLIARLHIVLSASLCLAVLKTNQDFSRNIRSIQRANPPILPTNTHMSSSTLLPAPLEASLQQIMVRSNQSGANIRAILLSTTEGVPLGRVYASDQPLNEDVLASIESVWAPAAKQIPVLGLEKLKQVTAIYDHGVLVHVYQGPMVCF